MKYINWFEIKSLLGRRFQNNQPPDIPNPRMLNLGCGEMRLPGFVNADFFDFQYRFWRRNPNGPDWICDFRYPLQCPHDYWDGIICEHTLEHLSFPEAKHFLREVFRILKPGSILRITVPDLEKYIRYYVSRGDDAFLKWSTGAEAISSLTQEWGHRSVWDAELLEKVLTSIGFSSVVRCEYLESSDARLLKDNPSRIWETLYMEARKDTPVTSYGKKVTYIE